MNQLPIAVIGSGPAGATTAHYLLKQGKNVEMIDIGERIEPELQRLSSWDHGLDREEFLDAVYTQRWGLKSDRNHLPAKLPFGSAFAYQGLKELGATLSDDVVVVSSSAKGGLSTAWGANICPVSQADTVDWPVKASTLNAFMVGLAEIMDCSGRHGGFSELFSHQLQFEDSAPRCAHAERILSSADRGRNRLRNEGLFVDSSLVAIGKRYSSNRVGCLACNLCMHGCPYNAIFNSAFVVQGLIASSTLKYSEQIKCLSFVESADKVVLELQGKDTGEVFHRSYSRVYLGAGVLGTADIIARSLKLFDQPIEILDSQKYLFPFLRFRSSREFLSEKAHSLAQIYVQQLNQQVCDNVVHGQLYGYNDLITENLAKIFGRQNIWYLKMLSPILSRTMIGMVYLHSNYSGRLYFKLSNDQKTSTISGSRNPDGDKVLRGFLKSMNRCASLFGGVALAGLVKPDKPGNSQHFGASFPMSLDAKHNQGNFSDILGRPNGLRRVHVVDSSVLPSIPGTPTTSIMMANAARIVNEAASLDE